MPNCRDDNFIEIYFWCEYTFRANWNSLWECFRRAPVGFDPDNWLWPNWLPLKIRPSKREGRRWTNICWLLKGWSDNFDTKPLTFWPTVKTCWLFWHCRFLFGSTWWLPFWGHRSRIFQRKRRLLDFWISRSPQCLYSCKTWNSSLTLLCYYSPEQVGAMAPADDADWVTSSEGVLFLSS